MVFCSIEWNRRYPIDTTRPLLGQRPCLVLWESAHDGKMNTRDFDLTTRMKRVNGMLRKFVAIKPMYLTRDLIIRSCSRLAFHVITADNGTPWQAISGFTTGRCMKVFDSWNGQHPDETCCKPSNHFVQVCFKDVPAHSLLLTLMPIKKPLVQFGTMTWSSWKSHL